MGNDQIKWTEISSNISKLVFFRIGIWAWFLSQCCPLPAAGSNGRFSTTMWCCKRLPALVLLLLWVFVRFLRFVDFLKNKKKNRRWTHGPIGFSGLVAFVEFAGFLRVYKHSTPQPTVLSGVFITGTGHNVHELRPLALPLDYSHRLPDELLWPYANRARGRAPGHVFASRRQITTLTHQSATVAHGGVIHL